MSNKNNSSSEPVQLKREIGVFGGISIIGGIMIGSGIFYLGSYVLQRTNMSFGWALVCWIIGGIVSLLGGLCFAERLYNLGSERLRFYRGPCDRIAYRIKQCGISVRCCCKSYCNRVNLSTYSLQLLWNQGRNHSPECIDDCETYPDCSDTFSRPLFRKTVTGLISCNRKHTDKLRRNYRYDRLCHSCNIMGIRRLDQFKCSGRRNQRTGKKSPKSSYHRNLSDYDNLCLIQFFYL